MNSQSLSLFAALLMIASTTMSNAQERVLFDFSNSKAMKPWQTVNDGVMGGRSVGQVKLDTANSKNKLRFFGTLSLDNNGGFASARARTEQVKLKKSDVIVARVRGDGREYNFNMYADKALSGYSWRSPFKTEKGKWIEVKLPINKLVATWRGRTFPQQGLDTSKVAGIGFLLGDKKPGPFQLEIEWIKVAAASKPLAKVVNCEGIYPHHLQGICADANAIYWSFTTTMVKTDLTGKLLKKIPVANHHGDLCLHDGKLFVAVNLGEFNNPKGNADSWVYVYDTKLKELARHETQQVFHGAGGIGVRGGHFFVVGGLPNDIKENYVYEYDADFKFLKKHIVNSGHTHLGIQTATFAHERWWFGCYGSPKVLLVTDANFQLKGKGRYEAVDCSLGIESLPKGRLLVASGSCDKNKGCIGSVRIAVPDDRKGIR